MNNQYRDVDIMISAPKTQVSKKYGQSLQRCGHNIIIPAPKAQVSKKYG